MSRNQNTSHTLDGAAPPPPYSATDIYSNSQSPSFMPLDDAALRASFSSTTSSSSTGDHVIYTPPMTPVTPSALSSTNSHHHHHHHSPPQLQQQRLLPTQPGAALYFASRPAPTAKDGLQSDIIMYVIKVQDSSVPGDFPYQDHWAAMDVTPRDWATFVNFLLSGHATGGSEAVLDRYSRAGKASDSDATSDTTGHSRLEAQPDHVREAQPAALAARSTSQRAVEATIQQWNDGFFGPRGMNLVLHNQDSGTGLQQEVDACATILGGLSVDDGHKNGISTSRTGTPMGQHYSGEGDSKAGPRSRQTGGPESHQPPNQERTEGFPPPFMGSFGGGSEWRRNNGHDPRCESHHCHQSAHDEADGRGRQAHSAEKYQRTSSASSTSSSVASSSSGSSSIGSLPGYDDIKEHQLPFYAERLQDWASHPDQIRTKNDVKALKAELQATAKSQSGTTRLVAAVDKRALKKQIRGLQAQWKSIKKAQKQVRRTHKRERRERRRAEKRERRQQKRAMRRAYKELKKANAGWGGPKPAGPLFGMRIPVPVPVPVVPPVVSRAMATAPVPPGPQGPNTAVEYMPWGHGFRRGCGGPSTQRGSFFFRPDGPFGPQRPAWGGRGCERRRHALGGRAPVVFDPGCRAGGSSHHDIPGAWPSDNAAPATGVTASAPAPAPGPASAAKYQAAEHLDAEMSKLAIQTASLDAGAEKLGLEKAMQALAHNRDRLRMEADEAYARDLAASKAWD
ncbi:hypothetical protein E4U55_007561 [Claviceps digitariae]|nr:hypothetical protein E4U55_007561 [Claviceps digitariae]